jgi:hypothetical protein
VRPTPAPALQRASAVVAELELHDRCDFSCLRVGCLDVAKVLSAVSENSDAPRPELGGPCPSISSFSVRRACL